MLHAHISQMVWFRYGWIYLSRYMLLNSLRREVVGVDATAQKSTSSSS
jgi:N-acetylglucosaminylphosphatidylinositol deacetylase